MTPEMRILAVEDDEGVRGLLEHVFAHAGLSARVVGSLSEFRSSLARYDAKICIIDIGLPDGDGLSLVSELRATGGRGILILTGRGSELDQVIGLELGADDYIVKPFRRHELLARIKAVARRLEGSGNRTDPVPDGTKLVMHGYSVDLEARSVSGPDGEEISLTTAEFDVLAVLLAHRGRAISRDEILTEIKGKSWHASSRGIDGLISRLRRKLPVPQSVGELIKTLHGIGYMLTPQRSQ